ncbi:hypothetical protein OG500_34155 [Kitasatospora sp. NBC_01250]|uniref:hypothetical protein n=1 Tax=unclassified Kitasatospora TaxID=2633591 RepID=UPI002E10191A|nr:MULTISPECIES: hypothetical protein [unclassified Kitasatospora]WSJ71010.1 hypothetical protein OG294_35700 [Kitasatospora sp. NBC_01302]
MNDEHRAGSPESRVSQESRIDDIRFGIVELTVDPEAGHITVTGPKLPPVALRRSPGTDSDRRSPIGTRAPALLELEIDGTVVAVDPGLGFVSRRSRRVDVRHDGRHYRLTPTADDRSTLLRDDHRIGEFVLSPDAVAGADWDVESQIAPLEAALGYLLAAAFGVGAPGFVKSAIGAGTVAF